MTEGYGALVEAYAAPLDVRLDCPVTLIDHSGPRLRIATPRGDIAARAAIVAVPASILAREALRFAPSLPDKVAAADALPLGLADKLFLRVDAPDDLPVETPPVRRARSAEHRQLSPAPVRPAGDRMLFRRTLALGARSAKASDAFARVAVDQLAEHLGADIRKRLHPIARPPPGAAIPMRSAPIPMHGRATPMRAACWPTPVDDRLFFAGEACSTHDYSTAHGAYRTGVAAANSVAKLLKK